VRNKTPTSKGEGSRAVPRLPILPIKNISVIRP